MDSKLIRIMTPIMAWLWVTAAVIGAVSFLLYSIALLLQTLIGEA